MTGGVRQATAARSGFPRPLSRLVPPLTMALPVTIFAVAALSFPLALARLFAVSGSETATWIAVLYGGPAVLSVLLSWRYRQPLLVAYSTVGTIAAATLVGHAGYAELRGAALAAGALVILLGAVGLGERVARWVPVPIVMAMVAGAVLPYVSGMFTTAGTAPSVVGAAFVAYVFGRRVLPTRPRHPPRRRRRIRGRGGDRHAEARRAALARAGAPRRAARVFVDGRGGVRAGARRADDHVRQPGVGRVYQKPAL